MVMPFEEIGKKKIEETNTEDGLKVKVSRIG